MKEIQNLISETPLEQKKPQKTKTKTENIQHADQNHYCPRQNKVATINYDAVNRQEFNCNCDCNAYSPVQRCAAKDGVPINNVTYSTWYVVKVKYSVNR